MNDYIIHNGELYHWGVKGMRWGHRKGPKESSPQLNPKKQKKELTPEEKKARGKSRTKKALAAIGVVAAVGAIAHIRGYIGMSILDKYFQ